MKIEHSKKLRYIHWILLSLLLPGVAWLCKPDKPVTAQSADQSFCYHQYWLYGLTAEHGWGPEHPRLLADVNADKHQDVIGFGNYGVWLATSSGYKFKDLFGMSRVIRGW